VQRFTGHRRVAGDLRVVEAERAEHPFANQLRGRFAGDLGDHLAEDREVGVGVVEAGAGLAGDRQGKGPVEQFVRGELAEGVFEQQLLERRVALGT
jgi:hypothetical protein